MCMKAVQTKSVCFCRKLQMFAYDNTCMHTCLEFNQSGLFDCRIAARLLDECGTIKNSDWSVHARLGIAQGVQAACP